MSREKVERVRAGYAAFNRGDLDAALVGFHPEVEWHVLGELPDQGVYRGLEGIARFWEMWSETFEGFRVDIEELIDAGDRVVALVAASGSGRASELPARTPTFAQIWTFADDEVVRVEMLPKDEALRAVRSWRGA